MIGDWQSRELLFFSLSLPPARQRVFCDSGAVMTVSL
jgi:hypothetical protein